MSPPLGVLYIRVIWAARWALLALTVVTALTIVGFQIRAGLGSSWEARARLAIGISGDVSSGTIQILKARLTSGDLAREIGLPAGAGVVVTGATVLDIAVTSPRAEDAIRAANALVERMIGEQVEAYRQAEVALAGQDTARRVFIERELGSLTVDRRETGVHLDAITRLIPTAQAAAEASIAQAAQSGKNVLVGDTPEERRLKRLEAERDRTADRIDRLDAKRVALTAPPAPSLPAPPRMTLTRIDRAVGATRLPSHIWWTLASGCTGALLVGVLGAFLRHWWREEMVEEQVRLARMAVGRGPGA